MEVLDKASGRGSDLSARQPVALLCQSLAQLGELNADLPDFLQRLVLQLCLKLDQSVLGLGNRLTGLAQLAEHTVELALNAGHAALAIEKREARGMPLFEQSSSHLEFFAGQRQLLAKGRGLRLELLQLSLALENEIGMDLALAVPNVVLGRKHCTLILGELWIACLETGKVRVAPFGEGPEAGYPEEEGRLASAQPLRLGARQGRVESHEWLPYRDQLARLHQNLDHDTAFEMLHGLQ